MIGCCSQRRVCIGSDCDRSTPGPRLDIEIGECCAAHPRGHADRSRTRRVVGRMARTQFRPRRGGACRQRRIGYRDPRGGNHRLPCSKPAEHGSAGSRDPRENYFGVERTPRAVIYESCPDRLGRDSYYRGRRRLTMCASAEKLLAQALGIWPHPLPALVLRQPSNVASVVAGAFPASAFRALSRVPPRRFCGAGA